MKFKTIIESRVPKKTPRNQLVVAMMLSIEIAFNTFLPFVVGFFFAVTQHFVFLLWFFFLVFFNIRFEYQEKGIKIKIIRGI